MLSVPRSRTGSRSGACVDRDAPARVVSRSSRACLSSAVRPLADGAAQLALLAHVSSLGRPRPSVGSDGSGPWRSAARTRAGRRRGRVSGSGVADRHRVVAAVDDDGGEGVLPVLGVVGLDGGLAEERRAQQPAGAVDADDRARAASPGAVGQQRPASGRPARCPSGPRARWRCRRAAATSAAIWGRTSLHRSPSRGAANARSSMAPSSPASITDWTSPVCSSTWSRSSVPSAGGTQSEPRSTRSIPSSARSSASHGPALVARLRGAPRRPSSSAVGRLVGSGWPCGGTSRASFLRSGLGRSVCSWREPKPPVEPYPPAPRTDSGRASTSTNAARSNRWTTSWAIRSPRRSSTGSVRVVVDQQHLDLAAVARVDGARGVHDRQPVPAARPERGCTRATYPSGSASAMPGRHQRPLAGREDDVDGRDQVGAGVAGVGVRRQRQVRVEPERPRSAGRAARRARGGRARPGPYPRDPSWAPCPSSPYLTPVRRAARRPAAVVGAGHDAGRDLLAGRSWWRSRGRSPGLSPAVAADWCWWSLLASTTGRPGSTSRTARCAPAGRRSPGVPRRGRAPRRGGHPPGDRRRADARAYLAAAPLPEARGAGGRSPIRPTRRRTGWSAPPPGRAGRRRRRAARDRHCRGEVGPSRRRH